MLNVLYINLARGSGIETIGNIKIEILSRITGIERIFVYSSQCNKMFREKEIKKVVDDKNIDLIIVEEGLTAYSGFDRDCFRSLPVPKILMAQCLKHEENVLYDYVISHYHHPHTMFLQLSPGNLFQANELYEKRLEKVVCLARNIDVRFSDHVYEKIEKKFGEVDLYCTENTGKDYGPFRYKGHLQRREIIAVLNSYDYILISAYECLSLPLREALLCGCLPVICDMQSYISDSRTYADDFLRFCVDIDSDPIEFDVKRKCLRIPDIYSIIQENLSFRRMCLTMLMYLRGITQKDLRWGFESTQQADIEFLHPEVRDKFIHDPCISWTGFIV